MEKYPTESQDSRRVVVLLLMIARAFGSCEICTPRDTHTARTVLLCTALEHTNNEPHFVGNARRAGPRPVAGQTLGAAQNRRCLNLVGLRQN